MSDTTTPALGRGDTVKVVRPLNARAGRGPEDGFVGRTGFVSNVYKDTLPCCDVTFFGNTKGEPREARYAVPFSSLEVIMRSSADSPEPPTEEGKFYACTFLAQGAGFYAEVPAGEEPRRWAAMRLAQLILEGDLPLRLTPVSRSTAASLAAPTA